MERAPCNVKCCCYSEALRGPCARCNCLLDQGQQGWGPNKLTIATRLSHHGKYQDALEWASESVLSSCLASGISLACMGKCGQATLDLWKLSVCLQHRRGEQSPLKWWSHLSCNRDRTTSSRVSNQRRKENCSEPSPWHTISIPQAYVRGRCTTGLDDGVYF